MKTIIWILGFLCPLSLVGQAEISVTSNIANPSCNQANGNSTGSIDITANGGVPGYFYEWSGAGVCHPCEDQSELGAGEYCVTVTDSNENTLETCFELEEPDEIVTTSVIENPSCNELSGWSDGTIDIIVIGGSEIFEYNWSGPEISQGKEDQFGLGEGNYSVTVSDSEGCAAISTFTLSEPTPIEIFAEVQDASCDEPSGQIDITAATGGTGPYTYNWSGNGVSITDQDQYNLTTGTYHVTVTDAYACIATAEFTLSAFVPIEINTTLQDADCTPGGEDLTIEIQAGAPPFEVSWISPTGGSLNQNELSINEVGQSVVYSEFDAFNEYNFTITDLNGCQISYNYISGAEPIREIATPSLCLITADTDSGNNLILWEDPPIMDFITQYNIYREGNANGSFNYVGSVDVSEENSFVDNTIDPTLQAYRYRITASDECDLESEASEQHKTIHLVANQGLNDRINLEWDTYNGITYDQVSIYRGISLDDMQFLISLPASVNSYTDPTPPTGVSFYQVEVSGIVDCDINRAPFSIRSNIATKEATSSITELSFEVKVTPNPVQDVINISSEESVSVALYSVTGREHIRQHIEAGMNKIDASSLESGYYILHLTKDDQQIVTKLIIQ